MSSTSCQTKNKSSILDEIPVEELPDEHKINMDYINGLQQIPDDQTILSVLRTIDYLCIAIPLHIYDYILQLDMKVFEDKFNENHWIYHKVIELNTWWEDTEYYEKCNVAAKKGDLDWLKYAHEKGCYMNDASYYAKINGHLDCLNYVYKHNDDCRRHLLNDCPSCLKLSNERERDEYTIKFDEYAIDAVESGKIDCLIFLNAFCGYQPTDKKITAMAAANGDLDCLKYLHKNFCAWDEGTTQMAAANGHLDCLEYLHENDCPWDEGTTQVAAENNHFDCLGYAVEYGCPWDFPKCFDDLSPHFFTITKKLFSQKYKNISEDYEILEEYFEEYPINKGLPILNLDMLEKKTIRGNEVWVVSEWRYNYEYNYGYGYSCEGIYAWTFPCTNVDKRIPAIDLLKFEQIPSYGHFLN